MTYITCPICGSTTGTHEPGCKAALVSLEPLSHNDFLWAINNRLEKLYDEMDNLETELRDLHELRSELTGEDE